MAPVVSYQALCREIAGMTFGELDMVGARSVLRRYSSEWFEAAKRRKAGENASFPRRKEGPAVGAVVPGHVPHRRRPRQDPSAEGSPAAGGAPRKGRALP